MGHSIQSAIDNLNCLCRGDEQST